MRSSSATRASPRSKYVLPVPVHAFAATDLLGPLAADVTLRTPPQLYAAGDLALLRDTRRVAIVGAREASEAGRRRARKLAAQLAREGVVVVSGLAKGIDRAAHEGALEAGGRTVAVIGTPLDRSYPAARGIFSPVQGIGDGRRVSIKAERPSGNLCHAMATDPLPFIPTISRRFTSCKSTEAGGERDASCQVGVCCSRSADGLLRSVGPQSVSATQHCRCRRQGWCKR